MPGQLDAIADRLDALADDLDRPGLPSRHASEARELAALVRIAGRRHHEDLNRAQRVVYRQSLAWLKVRAVLDQEERELARAIEADPAGEAEAGDPAGPWAGLTPAPASAIEDQS